MEALELACLGIVVIGVLAAMVYIVAKYPERFLAAKRRRRALAAWAYSRKWSFQADRNERLAEHYNSFRCLQSNDRYYAYNISAGPRNKRHVCAFDYHYDDAPSRGGSDSRGDFSAVIVTADLTFKPLLVQPRELLDLLTEISDYGNIDFESAEFSSRFFVKSPDKRWAYDVISQSTMEFLLAATRFSLQFAGPDIIAYHGRRFSIATFDAAIGVIEGVLDRLPPSLLRELRPGRANA